MERLEYISRSTIAAQGPEIDGLIEQCRRNNAALGLTGSLYFDGALFFQILEGERDALDGVYGRIKCDPRNFGVRLLKRRVTHRRIFPGWSMKLVEGSPDRSGLFHYDALRESDEAGLSHRIDVMRDA